MLCQFGQRFHRQIVKVLDGLDGDGAEDLLQMRLEELGIRFWQGGYLLSGNVAIILWSLRKSNEN